MFVNSTERLNNIVEYIIICHSLTFHGCLNYVQWKKKKKTPRIKNVQVWGQAFTVEL